MITYRTLDIDGLWNKIDTYDINPDKLVPRVQLKKIIQRFQTDHVELIIGPRQSGKTTLLMMLIHELDKPGFIPRRENQTNQGLLCAGSLVFIIRFRTHRIKRF